MIIIQVGDERGLEDDGNVGGIEELDWVGPLLPTNLLVFHRQVHAETLQIIYKLSTCTTET